MKSAYIMPGGHTVGFIKSVLVWVMSLTIRVRVSRAPGGGQLAVQGGGWSYAHIVAATLWCTMAQGLRQERSNLLYW